MGNDSTQEVQSTIHTALGKIGTLSPTLTEPYQLICTYTVQVVLTILAALIGVIIAYGAIGAPVVGLVGQCLSPGWYSRKLIFSFGVG
jgi:hypothetical protein